VADPELVVELAIQIEGLSVVDLPLDE